MSRFGECSFPFSFGGGQDAEESIHRSLLDEYAPGFDVSDPNQIAWIEARAEARVIACGWAANQRLRNQMQPLKMCETLATWETATRLRPAASDTLVARRAATASKLRGLSGNTMVDIRDAVRATAGQAYIGIQLTDNSNAITFWPGVNPGPPGYTWSSNVRRLRVQLTPQGVSDEQFQSIVAKVNALLGDMMPSDMSSGWFVADTVGAVSGFFVGVSKIGVTGL